MKSPNANEHKLFRAENSLKIHTKLRSTYGNPPKISENDRQMVRKKMSMSPSHGSSTFEIKQLNAKKSSPTALDTKVDNNIAKSKTINEFKKPVNKYRNGTKPVFTTARVSQSNQYLGET